MSALRCRHPCSGLKPVGNISSNGHWKREQKGEGKQRGRDYFRSSAHTSKGFLLYGKYHIASYFLCNWFSTQPIRDYCLGLFPCSFTCLWPWELSFCSSWLSGHRLGWSIAPARRFSFSIHKPPSVCVLRLVTKHMQVLQGSHSCFGPPKAFSLSLKLSQERFPRSETLKHHLFQIKGELTGNAQRPCYPIPEQAQKFIVPSESTLNITHQQRLSPCS